MNYCESDILYQQSMLHTLELLSCFEYQFSAKMTKNGQFCPHSSVVRAPVFQSGGRAFKPWAGTDMYVPAMLRSEYLLANKGYARHEFFFKKRIKL